MRRKQRIAKLRSELHRELMLQQNARKPQRRMYNPNKRKVKDTIKSIMVDREVKQNMIFQQTNKHGNKEEYGRDHALLIARMIHQIRERTLGPDGVSFMQQYYVTKGLKKFGKKEGKKAAMKELEQLVQRNCWEPKLIEELTPKERRKAVDAMMLLAEKNDGTIKGRCVFKGSDTCE